MGICEWCACERRIPRYVCVGGWVFAHGCQSQGVGEWCDLQFCIAYGASAEDQPPSEAIAAAAPAQGPVPRRSQWHYSGITETFGIVY